LSALTKIAVVLLVVASLLLSAGVVVFVNKVEQFKGTADAATAQLTKERSGHTETKAQLQSVNAEYLAATTAANNRLDALKQESASKDAAILEVKAQLAKLDQDKKGVEVAMGNMTKVQEGLQGQLAAAQAQVTDLRKIRDQLVDERHSLNVQLTDALRKYVDERASDKDVYATPSEYIRDLIRRDMQDRAVALNVLEGIEDLRHGRFSDKTILDFKDRD